ncbi:hypothetical protein ACFVIM_10830 [Streptomyces sp. NPDC057638]|uniref:hypothetical protein n=1 Tax=Streptomyces sp. NPDC057638 TaxID=3346190 RepID=UPI0036C745C6
MLALRLARGSHPLVLLRRLLVAVASGVVGLLLLAALAYALTHPGRPGASLPRLAWCLVPLAAVTHLSVAMARTDPSTRPRTGLDAIGLGPGQLGALAAASTAVAATLGSVLALLSFVHLRDGLAGLPFGGTAAEEFARGAALPFAGTLTLLALPPLTVAAVATLALRPRDRSGPGPDGAPRDGFPGGLPWGVALTAAGLAVGTYAAGPDGGGAATAPPGGLDAHPAGVLGGWLLTAVGLGLSGPALTHICGRLLQLGRPGAARLLAGRALMDQARILGRPLGVVCAVGSAGIALWTLYGDGSRPFGALTALGTGLVVVCAVAPLVTAALESRRTRATATAELRRIGTPPRTLRSAVLMRCAALVAVCTPLTWLVGTLAAVPLTR